MLVENLMELVPIVQSTPRIALDTEATGTDPYFSTLLLVQIGTEEDNYVVDVSKVEKRILQYLLQIVKERNIEVTAHNAAFDLKMIYHNFGVLFENVFDTQLAEVLAFLGIGEKYPSLDDLTYKYFGVHLNKSIRDEFIDKPDFEFTPEQIKYAEDDINYLLILRDKLEEILRDRGQWKSFKKIEMKVLPQVALMEYTGVMLNTGIWKELAVKAEAKAEEYEIQLKQIVFDEFDKFAHGDNAYDACESVRIPVKNLRKAEKEQLKSVVTYDEIRSEVVKRINWDSPYQPLHILNSLGVPTKSTNAKELALYRNNHAIVGCLLNEREELKKIDSFGGEFLRNMNYITQSIHTRYNQLGAATTRFSSANPNLQNIIADPVYRASFIARPGYVLATGDYSQIELRILAEASREPLFIRAFQEKIDLHRQTASAVFEVPFEDVTKEQRKFGKSMNFAVVYGTTAKGLAYNFGMDINIAQGYLDKYFNTYKILKKFIEKFSDDSLEKGYAVTMFGTKRFLVFPKKIVNHDDWIETYKTKRKAVNTLPQGTSANMIKLALIYLHYDNPFGYENFRPLLTVHDEIVCEYKEEIQDQGLEFFASCLKKAGEDLLKIVPVEYEITVGNCWKKD